MRTPRWPFIDLSIWPFVVIAGGVGRSPGINPLLKVDNDGIVTVESTRLPEASDFLRLPVYHGGMVRSSAAADAVVSAHFTPNLRTRWDRPRIQAFVLRM